MQFINKRILSVTYITLIALIIFYKTHVYYMDLEGVKSSFDLIQRLLDKEHHVTQYYQSPFRKASIERDTLKYYHPDAVLDDYYIYRMQSQGDTLRNYLKSQWFDAQPLHEVFQTDPIRNHTDKNPSNFTSSYLVAYSRPRQEFYEHLGIFETLYHMPLPESLYNKVTLAKYMNQRLQMLKDSGKSEECLRDAEFQKKSYLLDVPSQCQAFFAKAIPEYDNQSEKEVYNYVKKNNLHDQKGTELAFKAVFNQVAQIYDYGKLCNQHNQHDIIMQEYIRKPLLLDGRKFDIRLHMMITSMNPPTMYLYKRFYLMKCAYKFDHDTFKNQSHICSAGYQRRLHNQLQQEKNWEELQKVLPINQITESISYDEFGRRLLREGKIKDISWIETYMIPEMDKRFYHYLQSYFDHEGEINDTRVGEYNACEFNIDEDLNFYLLECTTNPNMIPQGQAEVMRNFQNRLHMDAIPIQIEYNRQKYNRVKSLIEETVLPYVQMKNGSQPLQNGELSERIKNSLHDQPIDREDFNEVFHRVDFQKAKKSCDD